MDLQSIALDHSATSFYKDLISIVNKRQFTFTKLFNVFGLNCKRYSLQNYKYTQQNNKEFPKDKGHYHNDVIYFKRITSKIIYPTETTNSSKNDYIYIIMITMIRFYIKNMIRINQKTMLEGYKDTNKKKEIIKIALILNKKVRKIYAFLNNIWYNNIKKC